MKAGKLNIQGGKNINVAKRKVASARGFMFNQHNVNISREGLKNLQQRLGITTLSADAIGTKTAIAINAIGKNVINTADELVIVCAVTGVKQSVVASDLVSSTDTSISINSSVLYFAAGDYVMFEEDFLNYYIRGGTITSRTILSNAQYRALNTTPITLATGATGLVLIPVNLVIIAVGYSSDKEDNRHDLYCGHSPTNSTLAAQYWDSIRNFNYRVMSDSTWNMTGDTGMIQPASIRTLDIKLYSSGDYESADFSLKVYLTYRIDSD
jgi:hypothetical protein